MTKTTSIIGGVVILGAVTLGLITLSRTTTTSELCLRAQQMLRQASTIEAAEQIKSQYKQCF